MVLPNVPPMLTGPVVPLPTWPTGLSLLDQCTGGGSPGEVWAVSGPPRVGADLLPLGMARAVARHSGNSVHWVSTHEDEVYFRDRVLTAEGGRFVAHDRLGSDLGEHEGTLAWIKAEVPALPLTFERAEPSMLLTAALQAMEREGSRLVVLDEIGVGKVVGVLPRLRRAARSSGCWVVVVVGDEAQGRGATLASTHPKADTLVWIERPDLYSRDESIGGEAYLSVHRAGQPMTEQFVAFQTQYARFINVYRQPLYGGRLDT